MLFDPKSQDHTKNPTAVSCWVTSAWEAHTPGKISFLLFVWKRWFSFLGEWCCQHHTTHLGQTLINHSKSPKKEGSSNSQNEYDLCWQGFGLKVLLLTGKYYVTCGCCSMWQDTYQDRHSRQHNISAQVLLPMGEQGICITHFPFKHPQPIWPKLDHFHCRPVKWEGKQEVHIVNHWLRSCTKRQRSDLHDYSFSPMITISHFNPNKWLSMKKKAQKEN